MKNLITALLIFISFSAYSQTYQAIGTPGMQRLISAGDTTYRFTNSSYGYTYFKSLAAMNAHLATKVSKSGDVMTGNLNFEPKSQVGYLLKDTFARSSIGSNYTAVVPDATLTFPSSSYLNVTGATNDFANYIEYINPHNYEFYSSEIKGTASSGSGGLGIGLISQVGGSNQYSVIVKYDLGAGTIGLHQSTAHPSAYSTSTSISFSTGDKFSMTVNIKRNVLKAIIVYRF